MFLEHRGKDKRFRRIRCTKYVAPWEMRNAFKIVYAKPKRNRQLGRLSCRWGDKIKIDLKKRGCGHMDWMYHDQDRVQKEGFCEHAN
jgi:hypothetical protein